MEERRVREERGDRGKGGGCGMALGLGLGRRESNHRHRPINPLSPMRSGEDVSDGERGRGNFRARSP